MEESKRDPLYHDRVTRVTFTTEHSNTHLDFNDLSEDEELDGEKLETTGTERDAGNGEMWETNQKQVKITHK